MLDLNGTPPPTPPHTATTVLTCRVTPDLAAWVRDTARADHTTTASVLRRSVETARDGRWPPDVNRWLLAQAACSDTPGDPDQAVIAIVRHLAVRWPNGARLHD